jgi:type VI secretion system protein ImpK
MNEQIYRVCADVLVLASQIPTSPSLPSAGELKQRVVAALDSMVSKGRTFGISDADIAEARYALVAFVDEQVLKSTWAGRNEWMAQPLQLLLFREYTAGENFFVRLRALLQSGTRPVAVEVYYLCLALGFRGAYGASGDVSAPASYAEAARQQIARTLPQTAKIGPNAQPSDRANVDKASNKVVFAILAACTLLVVIVFGSLQWALSSNLKQALSTTSPRATSAAPATSSQ